MVALLKRKSKITLEQKPRVKYEIKNIFKRPKLDDQINSQTRAQVDNVLGTSGTGKTSKKIEATIIEEYETPMDI